VLSLKFSQALDIDQGLLGHSPIGDGVPLNKIELQKFKIWLKIQRVRAYNFGQVSTEYPHIIFPGDMPLGRADNVGTILEENLEGQKTYKCLFFLNNSWNHLTKNLNQTVSSEMEKYCPRPWA